MGIFTEDACDNCGGENWCRNVWCKECAAKYLKIEETLRDHPSSKVTRSCVDWSRIRELLGL